MGGQFRRLLVSLLTQGLSLQNYLDQPDPIACMSVTVDTSDRIYDDFNSLLFLHVHREQSTLTNELPIDLSSRPSIP